MAFEAQFRSGNPTVVDYTPTGGNVASGQVVVLVVPAANTTATGLVNGVAHLDIANNALGALAVGGGIYDVTMLTNLAAYTKVFWDDVANKVVSTSANNGRFGYLLGGNTGANTVVPCLHDPLVE